MVNFTFILVNGLPRFFLILMLKILPLIQYFFSFKEIWLFFSLETTSRKKIRLPGANRECRINLTSIFLSPLKKIAICKPYTCVFNGNVNFLRLSEIQPTQTLCFYIMTRASQTSYCRSVIRILPFFLKICTLYQIKVPCFYLGILRV